MEVKDYLIIYGHSYRCNIGCYKEQEINPNDIVKFTPLIKEIEKLVNSERNWNTSVLLERDELGNYHEHHLLYDMYPMINPNLLEEFSKLLPNNISKIESIKIFSGQKIKIL